MTEAPQAERATADLHLHSRFSRATSRSLDLHALAEAAAVKGIDLLSASDFTHPAWMGELRESLDEVAPGLYRLSGQANGPLFVMGTEVNCVWQQSGRGRRVHILIFAPDMDAAERVSGKLAQHGELESDGRPTFQLSGRDLLEEVWEADERCEIIPAHVWTPWYGVYGSRSGFDSMQECFGEHAGRLRAVETGLSSDPEMNWRVADVDSRAIVSFSDAHSPANLARELTVFRMPLSYDGLRGAISAQAIEETIEFFPENGKYHLDGHRACSVRMEPAQSAGHGGRCPSCGRKMTLGVLNRVEAMADRKAGALMDDSGLIHGPAGRPPYRRLAPLRSLIAAALGVGQGTKRVGALYEALIAEHGGEVGVLTTVPEDDIARVAGEAVAQAVSSVRRGELDIDPGYDGVFGTVRPRTSAARLL